MAEGNGEFKRLARELLEAWDIWIDADRWGGAELDALAEVVRKLREQVEPHQAET